MTPEEMESKMREHNAYVSGFEAAREQAAKVAESFTGCDVIAAKIRKLRESAP